MRLADMTVGLLRHAIRVYAEVAWAASTMPPVTIDGDDSDPLEPRLGALVEAGTLADETLRTGDVATRIFTLRLGNPHYPFMKLVLQEHLVEGMFFFSVDTHDQMFGGGEAQGADLDELQELKRANLALKEKIEHAWDAAGLPTAAHIKGLVETWPTRPAPPNGRHILLVDNDCDIAGTLAVLLRARGYEVTVLEDGSDAVERADPAIHDLILMDNEMKYLDGCQACRVLKSRPATAKIPVLIATAGALSLQQLDTADGFLVKPFRMELLFSILDHMLGRVDKL